MNKQNKPGLFPQLNLESLLARSEATAESWKFIEEIHLFPISIEGQPEKEYGLVFVIQPFIPDKAPWKEFIERELLEPGEIKGVNSLEERQGWGFHITLNYLQEVLAPFIVREAYEKRYCTEIPDENEWEFFYIERGDPLPNAIHMNVDETIKVHFQSEYSWQLFPNPEMGLTGGEPTDAMNNSTVPLIPIPKGKTWEDITFQFLGDYETVTITVRGTRESLKYRFDEIGFADPQRKHPNKQWWLLLHMAQNNGWFQWTRQPRLSHSSKKEPGDINELPDDTNDNYDETSDEEFKLEESASDIIAAHLKSQQELETQKQLFSRTRKTLRKLFGLEGDPIPNIPGSGWKTAFHILFQSDPY